MKKFLLLILVLPTLADAMSSANSKPVSNAPTKKSYLWLSHYSHKLKIQKIIRPGYYQDTVVDNVKLYNAWIAGEFSLNLYEDRKNVPSRKIVSVLCNNFLVDRECELQSYIHKASGIVVHGYGGDAFSSMKIVEPFNMSETHYACNHLEDYIPNDNDEFQVGTIVKPLTLLAIKSLLK